MAAKFVIIVALAACIYAAEEERVKKDVVLGTVPYAYSPFPYSYAATYDGVKYFPGGKYEKTIVAPALTSYHAPVAQVAPVAPVVSAYSAHSVHPVPYTTNYGYHYGGYPLVKSYVY